MPKRSVLLLDVGGELCGARPRAKALSFLRSHLPGLLQTVEIDFRKISSRRDGSEVSPREWARIGKLVHAQYEYSDGFVIWHPVNTLAYTASALSFMFENLAKPVVVSGALLPLSEKRNDAVQNLTNSLIIAAGGRNGLPRISEVIDGAGVAAPQDASRVEVEQQPGARRVLERERQRSSGRRAARRAATARCPGRPTARARPSGAARASRPR